MNKAKKFLIGAFSCVSIAVFTAVNSLAATVTLPPEFDDVKSIVETILKIVEYLGKIISMFF